MTAPKALPPVELLRSRLTYSKDSGALVWKERAPDSFKTPSYATGWNTKYKGKAAGRITNRGYIQIEVDHSAFYAHRIIWKMVHGEEPPIEIDHLDGDRSNNRIENLRAANKTINSRNRVAETRDMPVGVYYMPSEQAFRAVIGVGGGKIKYLGLFPTANLAHAARRGAEVILGYSQRQR